MSKRKKDDWHLGIPYSPKFKPTGRTCGTTNKLLPDFAKQLRSAGRKGIMLEGHIEYENDHLSVESRPLHNLINGIRRLYPKQIHIRRGLVDGVKMTHVVMD